MGGVERGVSQPYQCGLTGGQKQLGHPMGGVAQWLGACECCMPPAQDQVAGEHCVLCMAVHSLHEVANVPEASEALYELVLGSS